MDYSGKRLLHTPEGVRDIYGREYASKQMVQKLFGEKLYSYGYQNIQTPTFEFLMYLAVKLVQHHQKNFINFLIRKEIHWC